MTSAQPGIILAARYACDRLRGKALKIVGERTILEHCLRKLTAAGVGRVVLATTSDAEDDVLEMLASRMGVAVFRGERDDVLRRVVNAARTFNLDPILPATLDACALDVQAPGRIVAGLGATGADYIYEEGLPQGAAIEGMRTATLMKAAELATGAYERRHPTVFIKHRRDLFRVTRLAAPPELSCPLLKLTIDTAADLDSVRELFLRTESADPSVAALIETSGIRGPKASAHHGLRPIVASLVPRPI